MKNLFRLLMIFLISGIIISACSDDDDDNPNKPATEFIAEQSDFANYNTWTMVGEYTGTHPKLGDAHKAGAGRRIVYVNKTNVQMTDGEWPNGLIMVKEVLDENNELVELVAMSKRGGDFNSDHNGWEWFMLDPASGKINEEMRGANLMNGMCNMCHSEGDNDYSFVLGQPDN